VYRLGLVLHAVYYTTLLVLREHSPDHAIALGALLGVTWGVFWAGANVFNYDVSITGRREFYYGMLQTVTGCARLVSPVIGGFIIQYASTELQGYHRVFGVVACIYIAAFLLSFRMHQDSEPRPFRIRRALFPGRDQRDWRLVMFASASMAGAYSIFQFLLGLLMYMETGSALNVGGLASIQALAAIVTALIAGRMVTRATRVRSMAIGTAVLVAAGLMVSVKLSIWTLIAFGVLRSIAGPLFDIPHFSVRMDIISKSMKEPWERIEYISAWEAPLAAGRVVMMTLMAVLFATLGVLGLKIMLCILSCMRIVTFLLLKNTDEMRAGEKAQPADAVVPL
jgi:YQGE family putative transporter